MMIMYGSNKCKASFPSFEFGDLNRVFLDINFETRQLFKKFLNSTFRRSDQPHVWGTSTNRENVTLTLVNPFFKRSQHTSQIACSFLNLANLDDLKMKLRELTTEKPVYLTKNI